MRHGFLLIDKPLGFTSHDVVAVARKALSERGIGHLGTLDPAATGLLVLAVGRKALKVVHLFDDLRKEYIADVRFGSISTTYDREGVLTETPPPAGWTIPEQGTVQRVIADRLIGKIQQVPPAYSAISIGGKRSYDLARQGKQVELPAREVHIETCQILSYNYPDLQLRINCSSGTYIRSLAHDLGGLLHCGGYLAGLRRTEVGEWSVANAKEPAHISWANVIPLKDVLKNFPARELSDDDWQELQFGRNIEASIEELTVGWKDGLPVVLLIPAQDGTAHAKKVL